MKLTLNRFGGYKEYNYYIAIGKWNKHSPYIRVPYIIYGLIIKNKNRRRFFVFDNKPRNNIK